MTNVEEQVLIDERQDREPRMVSTCCYSDEFYESYILKFKPSQKKRFFYRFVKRLFDLLVSFLGIAVLLFPFLVISIAIKCDSKGPVIFKNRRVGKNGKMFYCWKFRTMSIAAPAEVATSLGGVECYITKVGRFLRKTSLDETAQLFNVLLGNMSFIGYRPLVPTEQKCNDMRDKLGVFSMKPGISGYAQVKGRDTVYYKNKAILDAYYVKHASIWFDIKLMFLTVSVVLKRKGNQDEEMGDSLT